MTNNTNQFVRLKQSIAVELSTGRYRKVDLTSAYSILTKTQISCKKSQLADLISAILVQDLEKEYKSLTVNDNVDEDICKKLIQKLEEKLQVLNLRGLSFSKKIQDIFNFETHSNPYIMSNNRQPRVIQETVQNIWNSSTNQFQCLCPKAPSNLQLNKKVQTCYRCGYQFHADCFWSPDKGELFQCPFCYLKFCTPHKQVKQILFGGFLPILKKQKVEYKINLPLDNKVKVDKSLYLQARCVKFNNKNRYEISWPDNASLSIGKNRISQFKPLQTNSPLKRRADEPIKLDKNRLQLENQIIIEQRNVSQNGYKLNKKCYHLVAIMVITDLSNEAVLSKYEKNMLSVKQSKKFLTDQMSQQSGDIQIQKIAISLKCQYFGGKMKLPARSKLCNTHFQPFDLMNFINSSIHAKSSTRKWKCPICDKRAYDLIIDKYILDLMTQNPNVNEIVFKQNGQPEMIQEKEDSNQQQNQNEHFQTFNEKKCQIVIDIDQQQQILPEAHIAQNKQANKQSQIIQCLDQQQDKINTNGKQTMIQDKKNSNHIRPNEPNEKGALKKLRKLNDGSLEVIPITQSINIVDLQSDQQVVNVDKIQFSKKTQNQNRQQLQHTQKKNINQKNERNTRQKIEKQKNLKNHKQNQTQSGNINKLPVQSKNRQKNTVNQQKFNQSKQLAVIDIDSDNQPPKKSKQQTQKQLTQKMQQIRRSMQKQGKTQISEEDTQIFQSIFSKVMSFSHTE